MTKSSSRYVPQSRGASIGSGAARRSPAVHALSASKGEGGASHSAKRIIGKVLEALEVRPALGCKWHPPANALSAACSFQFTGKES